MKIANNSTVIGNVTVRKITSENSVTYSDGDETEDYLLNLFKKGLSENQRRSILASTKSWPIKYHLAYERLNLLSWYNFKPNSKILEIGAGCGSITESLVKNSNVEVYSNDLSERRCLINAYRNRGTENLEIVVGNLYDYKPDFLFDYVVCVGVFEYSGMFIDTPSPYQDFLTKIHSFLKPGGVLLLAIENQMGVKYFSGAREDHTANYFDGLNDYPQKKRVRTFGKKELIDRLGEAGFYHNYFFYPYPDYKLPTLVYSDDYMPGINNIHMPKGVLPTSTPDQAREHIFSESAFISILERNNLYGELANSFLVEAKI